MNDYEKTIEVLQNRVRELEQLIRLVTGIAEPVAKWQPKGGGFWVSSDGEIEEVDSSYGASLFGTERKTQLQAERASVEMRRFNRLLALRDELCGDAVVYWSDNDKQNYFVCFSHQTNRWYVSSDEIDEVMQPYFTNKKAAQKACDMLNSGEVEL